MNYQQIRSKIMTESNH